jgi:hypothetical protein
MCNPFNGTKIKSSVTMDYPKNGLDLTLGNFRVDILFTFRRKSQKAVKMAKKSLKRAADPGWVAGLLIWSVFILFCWFSNKRKTLVSAHTLAQRYMTEIIMGLPLPKVRPENLGFAFLKKFADRRDDLILAFSSFLVNHSDFGCQSLLKAHCNPLVNNKWANGL